MSVSDEKNTLSSPEEAPAGKVAPKRFRVVKWILWPVGIIIALIVIALAGITLYLTPDRLTRLINTRGSEYFNADVTSHNARFTIWSSFPRLCIEIDSVRIVSRSLDALPAYVRESLPEDSRQLAWCGRIKGGINLLSLLTGVVNLHDVSADGFNLNLVAVNDSVANYLILPPRNAQLPDIPKVKANYIRLTNPGQISVFSAQSHFSGLVDLSQMDLQRSGRTNRYRLASRGSVTAVYDSLRILSQFPFSLDGDIDFRFKPFSLEMKDYKIGLGNLRTSTNLNLITGENPHVDGFDLKVDSFRLMQLMNYLPEKFRAALSGFKADPSVLISARLMKPYIFSSSALPTLRVSFKAAEGAVSYPLSDGKNLKISHSGLSAVFLFDGDDPARSSLSIPKVNVVTKDLKCSLVAKVSDILGSPIVETDINANSSLSELAAMLPDMKGFSVSGRCDSDVRLRFRLASYQNPVPDSVEVSGDVKLKNVQLQNKEMKFGLDNLALSFDMKENPHPDSVVARRPAWKDAKALRQLSHSPVYVSADLPEKARRILNKINFNIDLASGSGKLTLKNYPAPIFFGESDISLSNDSISLRRFSFRSGPSRMVLSGILSGLRRFLTAPPGSVENLNAQFNIAIDTLDINNLARAYEDAVIAATGRPPVSAENIRSKASDSVAYLIPRNISANIRATAGRTLWTNLDFRNLRTSIWIANGDLAVNGLRFTTSFAQGGATLRYTSSSIECLDLDAEMSLSDINLLKIYGKFPSLVEMEPQIRNLSGILGASGKINAQIYPNMAFDMSSMTADMKLSGRGLNVHQTDFIHRIVRLLGITNHDNIKIDNLDVHAYVHDNLLELYPFDFGFDRYKISLEGINNFAGDLDYHIAVLKAPIPLHFGVNISGKYAHPHVSLGRAEWNRKKSAVISSEVEQSFTFNLVKEMRKGVTMFVHKAATSPQAQKK